MKDTLFTEESSNQIAQYQNEKKEKEIELLKKDKELQDLQLHKNRIMIYAFSSGFVLMLILAFVIFSSYRQKKKANELLSENNQDITDSIEYAKQIQ